MRPRPQQYNVASRLWCVTTHMFRFQSEKKGRTPPVGRDTLEFPQQGRHDSHGYIAKPAHPAPRQSISFASVVLYEGSWSLLLLSIQPLFNLVMFSTKNYHELLFPGIYSLKWNESLSQRSGRNSLYLASAILQLTHLLLTGPTFYYIFSSENTPTQRPDLVVLVLCSQSQTQIKWSLEKLHQHFFRRKLVQLRQTRQELR